MSTPFALSPKKLAKLATKAVKETARSGRKGPQAHRFATRLMAKKVRAFARESIDDAVEWPDTPAGDILEQMDGPIIGSALWLFGSLVQGSYDKWQAQRSGK